MFYIDEGIVRHYGLRFEDDSHHITRLQYQVEDVEMVLSRMSSLDGVVRALNTVEEAMARDARVVADLGEIAIRSCRRYRVTEEELVSKSLFAETGIRLGPLYGTKKASFARRNAFYPARMKGYNQETLKQLSALFI